jgi:hypothetical protein
MTPTTRFGLTLSLILIVGTGLLLYVKKESDYVSYFHSIYLPEISSSSFLIGCLYGSENNIELCKKATEAFEYDAKKMLELTE